MENKYEAPNNKPEQRSGNEAEKEVKEERELRGTASGKYQYAQVSTDRGHGQAWIVYQKNPSGDGWLTLMRDGSWAPYKSHDSWDWKNDQREIFTAYSGAEKVQQLDKTDGWKPPIVKEEE